MKKIIEPIGDYLKGIKENNRFNWHPFRPGFSRTGSQPGSKPSVIANMMSGGMMALAGAFLVVVGIQNPEDSTPLFIGGAVAFIGILIIIFRRKI